MLRRIAMVIVIPATYLFVYWVPFSLIPLGEHRWIAHVVSLLAAIAVARFVWVKMDALAGAKTSILVGAFLVGGIGFAVGFFGPIYFAPEANQGPLLGIFITGPLGFVVGAVGGLIYWIRRNRKEPA